MPVLERDFARLKEKVEILLGERGAAGRRAVRLEEVTRTVDRAVTAVKTVGRVAWDNVTGVPSTFPPTAHTHPITGVTGLEEALANKASSSHTHGWSAITGKPTEFPPETHTHDFSEITGTVTVAWANITGVPSTFPPSAHSHATSDVTGLDTALAGKAAASHSHSDATTGAAGFMSAADKTKLNGIATGANAYTHPSGDGNRHVPATGTGNNGRFLKAGATAASEAWAAIQQADVVGLVAKITLLESLYYSGRSPEAKALQEYLYALGTPFSYDRLVALDSIIIDPIKSAGAYAKLDALHVYAAHSEVAALVNLVNPGVHNTTNGSVPFVVDSGLAGDGVGNAVMSGNMQSLAHYSLNDAHFGVVIGNDAPGDTNVAMGVASNAGANLRANIFPRSSANQFQGRINDASSLWVSGGTTALGHWGMNRSGATARQAYHDGEQVGADPQVADVIPNAAFTVLRQATARGTHLIRADHIGASLTSGEWSDLHAAITAYLAVIDEA